MLTDTHTDIPFPFIN